MPSKGGTMLAELPEGAAMGRHSDIYGALRSATGAPVVALIFRHLATHPGVLEEVWEQVGPLVESGELQEVAWSTAAASVPDGLVPPISRDAQAALGYGGRELVPLVNAIDAYNRANPVNLLIMLSLLRRFGTDGSTRQQHPRRSWSPPPAIGQPLGPMLSPADTPPHVRALVDDFALDSCRGGDAAVVPSLLRHLAAAPPLLAVLHVAVMPRIRDGSLAAVAAELRRRMDAAAASLSPQLGPLHRLAALPEVAATIRTFTDGWIPLMTLVGLALRRALDDRSGER